MTFIVRYCDNCTTDEVCLADEERREKVPRCHRIKYAKDPTGCGGLCELEQICHRLGHGAFRYSKNSSPFCNSIFYKSIKGMNITTT